MQAVILCGGLGTRLRPITNTLPKAMIPVEGRPFLEYQISLLRRGGVRELVLCVGYLAERIVDHFGDGRRFGIRIKYSFDGADLRGPAGALGRASHYLGDAFLVTYGDAYLRADYRMIMEHLVRSGNLGVMTVYRNDNKYGKSDLIVRNGRVVRYDKKRRIEGMHWINYGISALRKRALDLIPRGRSCDEERFYGELISRNELIAFPVTKRFYEIGTPASLEEFSKFVRRPTSNASRL